MKDKNQSDQIEETKKFAAEHLTGDVAAFLLDRLKTFGKPWAAMSEDEQAERINECKDAAEHLVQQAVEIISAEGRKAMIGTVDSITVKDGIKAVIKLSKQDESRHDLMDAQGQTVILVVADAEAFTGEKDPLLPDPDQEDMIDKAKKLKDDKVHSLKK